jgi:hypothetical protein
MPRMLLSVLFRDIPPLLGQTLTKKEVFILLLLNQVFLTWLFLQLRTVMRALKVLLYPSKSSSERLGGFPPTPSPVDEPRRMPRSIKGFD